MAHGMIRLVMMLAVVGLMIGCGSEKTNDNAGNEVPAQGKYSITAEVNGLGAQLTRFIGTVGTVNYLIDSAFADASGKVSFGGDSLLPGGLYYFVFPDNSFIQFLLDKDQEMVFRAEKADLVGTMKVEGSLDNELFYQNLVYEMQFQPKIQPLEAKVRSLGPGPERDAAVASRDALIAERKAHIRSFQQQHPESFFTVFKLAGQNPDLKDPKLPDGSIDSALQVFYYRMEFWDNVNFADERLLHTPVITNKFDTYIGKITDQRIDSVIKYGDIVIEKAKVNKEMFKFLVNQMAIKYNQSPIMGGEAIFVHVIDRYFTDDQAFWSNAEELAGIRKKANDMRSSLLGNTAQDLTCTNLAGQQESLLAIQSPIILLYIWDYTCEHCQEQTPEMVKQAAKWKSKGVEVYALCTGQDEQEWRKFVQKYQMQGLHNVYDPKYASNYYQKYHIDITPELYVINRERKIVAKDLHPNQLDETLKKELGK